MDGDMTDKRFIYFVIMIINLLGIVIATIGNVYVAFIANIGIYMKVAAVFAIIAMLFSVVYLFRGYKKDAAKFYKIFIYLFLLAQLANIVSVSQIEESNVVTTVMNTIVFGLTVVLATYKDLGKVKSLILCGIIFLWSLITTIMLFSMIPGVLRGGSLNGTLLLLRSGANLSLSFVLATMICAKYIDKAMRGRKT